MILDIVCLVIIVIALLVGLFKGLFKMASRLVSLILAFVVASYFAATVSTFVFNTFIENKLCEIVDTKIEETGAQETVEAVYTTITEIQVGIAQIQGGEIPDGLKDSVVRAQNFGTQVSDSLSAIGIDTNQVGQGIADAGAGIIDSVKNSDAFKTLLSKYDELSGLISGLDPNILKGIAGDVDLSSMDTLLDKVETLNPIQKIDPVVNNQVSKALVDVLRVPIINLLNPICFVLLYIVGLLVFGIILNLVVTLLEKINIVDKVQKIGGAILGAIFGVGISLIVVFAAQMFITPANELYYSIDGAQSVHIAEGIKNLALSYTSDNTAIDAIGTTK